MIRIDKVNNYGSISAIEKIASVKKVKSSNSFHEQFNSMELAKKATQPDKFDLFDKEEDQTIGGINLNKVLLTYDKRVNENKIEQEGDKVNKHIEDEWKNHKSEYSYFAENGLIEYNGVTFQYDGESDTISLGNMADIDNVLTINLSGGTTLRVNRNHIDSLLKAIDMFKPEDIKKIMEAIAIDTRSRNKPLEVEKEENETFDEMMDKMDGKEVTKKEVEKENRKV